MGRETALDKGLRRRVYWGERGLGCFGVIGCILYVLSGRFRSTLVPAFVACALSIAFLVLTLYKNISRTILKRLLNETTVVIILGLGGLNLGIEIYKPTDPGMSQAKSLAFLVLIVGCICMDAVKVKSRMYVLGAYTIFVVLALYSIYERTLGTVDNGIELVSYKIHDETTVIWKRDTKRSILIQVLLFSVKGIFTAIQDKKMQMMLFATGNIYRESGTASIHKRDRRYRETMAVSLVVTS